MSYILDALRRADAERERGAVPGLHAQPQVTAASPPGGARASRLWRVGTAAGALVLVLAVGVAWWVWERAAPALPVQARPTGSAPAPAQAAADVGTTPDADIGTAAPPGARGPAGNVAGLPGVAVSPTVEPPPLVGLPLPTPPGVAAETRPEPEPAVKPRPPSRASSPPVAVAQTPPAAESRVYGIDELPPEIRRALPKLAITGSIYSEDAASRFIMVNGDVVREGGRLGPELILEQIQIKSAVLRFKGYRYRIGL